MNLFSIMDQLTMVWRNKSKKYLPSEANRFHDYTYWNWISHLMTNFAKVWRNFPQFPFWFLSAQPVKFNELKSEKVTRPNPMYTKIYSHLVLNFHKIGIVRRQMKFYKMCWIEAWNHSQNHLHLRWYRRFLHYSLLSIDELSICILTLNSK